MEQESSKYFDSQNFKDPELNENLNKYLFGEASPDNIKRGENRDIGFEEQEGNPHDISDRKSKQSKQNSAMESNRGMRSRFYIENLKLKNIIKRGNRQSFYKN